MKNTKTSTTSIGTTIKYATATREQLIEIIAEEHGIEERLVTENFFEETDSLDRLAIQVQIENEFNIVFEDEELNKDTTITELLELVNNKLK